MIDKYLQYIRYEKNYSSHTVLSYKNDLEQFSGFITTQKGTFKPENITPDDVREWIISLMDIGEKTTSVNRKISALRGFYKYLNRNGLIISNPTLKIINPKNPKPLPVFFQEKEMDKCLEISEKDTTFEGVRDTLLVEIIYQTGLRNSEVSNLQDVDVDTVRKQLKVTGKGNKQRIIPFGDELALRVDDYRKTRQREIGDTNGAFFVTDKNTQLSTSKIYGIVKKLMSNVTTKQKRSPHVLRHTFATTLLNDGADINTIKELLGHSSLAATQVYTHATFDKIKSIYQKTHPRGGNKKGGIMEVRIQAIKFDATEKLQQFINKKISKLEKMYDDITTAEVYLKVVKPESAENKEAEITIIAPNAKFFASKVCDTFEEAVDLCVDALEKQIEKAKSKK